MLLPTPFGITFLLFWLSTFSVQVAAKRSHRALAHQRITTTTTITTHLPQSTGVFQTGKFCICKLRLTNTEPILISHTSDSGNDANGQLSLDVNSVHYANNAKQPVMIWELLLLLLYPTVWPYAPLNLAVIHSRKFPNRLFILSRVPNLNVLGQVHWHLLAKQ